MSGREVHWARGCVCVSKALTSTPVMKLRKRSVKKYMSMKASKIQMPFGQVSVIENPSRIGVITTCDAAGREGWSDGGAHQGEG